MEKSGSKPLHLQGRIQKDHHLTISGCRNGHGPGLNGEPYALKGARTVRGGEALTRFLLHSQPRKGSSVWQSRSISSPAKSSAGHEPARKLPGRADGNSTLKTEPGLLRNPGCRPARPVRLYRRIL